MQAERAKLSEKRSAWWDERLENWALWKAGGTSTGVSAYDGMWGDGAPRPPPPLVGEALDTDTLVGKLALKLQQAVIAWYVWSGALEFRSRDMDMDPKTLRTLVATAKEELERLDGERWESISRRRLADAA